MWLIALLAAVVVLLGLASAAIIKGPTGNPLARAVFQEELETARSLLAQGANPDTNLDVAYQFQPGGVISATLKKPIFAFPFAAKKEKVNSPILIYAAMQGNGEMVRLLLTKGANVNARDDYGQTALIAAAWKGSTECTAALLHKRADVTLRDKSGKTALQWAQTEKHEELAAILKQSGANE